MHSLDDVTTVVEDSSNIFRVNSAGEVRVAVVGRMLFGVTARWLLRDLQEVVPDEVFCTCEFSVRPLLYLLSTLRGQHVVDKLRKIVFKLGLARHNFLLQQVLLVKKQYHRDGSETLIKLDKSQNDSFSGKNLNKYDQQCRIRFFLPNEILISPKPTVVPNTTKQFQGLSETVLRGILPQDHVVGAGAGDEDDGGDVVKTLDPLPPLITLTTHIKHVKLHTIHPEHELLYLPRLLIKRKN